MAARAGREHAGEGGLTRRGASAGECAAYLLDGAVKGG